MTASTGHQSTENLAYQKSQRKSYGSSQAAIAEYELVDPAQLVDPVLVGDGRLDEHTDGPKDQAEDDGQDDVGPVEVVL